MNRLPVTVAQFELAPDGSFDMFAARIAAVVDEAANAGSRAVLFPELVTTSLLAARDDREEIGMVGLDRVYREHFPMFTDDLIALYRELADRSGIVVVGGSHLRAADKGEVRNTAHVVFPGGRVVRQDKLHLTPAERTMGVTPGERIETFEIDGMLSAVQICADIEFPEIPRILATRGVEAIFCPSLTWNTRGAERVRIGAHARAMENQVFVLVSPLVHTSGFPRDVAIHGTGNARVAVPLDRNFGKNDGVWAQSDDTRRGAVLHTTLDRDLMAASRENPEPPGFSHVRTELYRLLATDIP